MKLKTNIKESMQPLLNTLEVKEERNIWKGRKIRYKLPKTCKTMNTLREIRKINLMKLKNTQDQLENNPKPTWGGENHQRKWEEMRRWEINEWEVWMVIPPLLKYNVLPTDLYPSVT